MQQENAGNTTHCPDCGRFGSTKLGGRCKPCFSKLEKEPPDEIPDKEYDGYVGDHYFSDRFGVEKDLWNEENKFPIIGKKFGYEDR